MSSRTEDTAAADDGLLRRRITDDDVALLRERCGYPNPTLRKGLHLKPWNVRATADSIRRWAECIGDSNMLYNDENYARRTRWQGPIAPPGFEWSTGWDKSRNVPDELHKRTQKALRGIQLYHSGAEYFYYRPIAEGTVLSKAEYVADVKDRRSSHFGVRSVIVNNGMCWWDDADRVYITGSRWFVHVERREFDGSDGSGTQVSEAAAPFYSDDDLAEIERAYDNEYFRGGDTLYLEDIHVGQSLPTMVKGPLTITDMINMHMAGGWLTYGNLPFRLSYENRKKLRGFYSRNEFNAWDTIQRVHWDPSLAKAVGLPRMYDIGPMRFVMLCHYLSNFAGDDAWVHRIRYELRSFNYVGDTTWIKATVTAARVDETLGPLVEVDISGVNQRGQENIAAQATILVASRTGGLAQLPPAPAVTAYRSGSG